MLTIWHRRALIHFSTSKAQEQKAIPLIFHKICSAALAWLAAESFSPAPVAPTDATDGLAAAHNTRSKIGQLAQRATYAL